MNAELASSEGKIVSQAEKFCFSSSSCGMKFYLLVPVNHFTNLRKMNHVEIKCRNCHIENSNREAQVLVHL